MSDADTSKFTVTEHIQFHKDGSSTHTWTFPDGSTRQYFFRHSPIIFLEPGSWPPKPPPSDLRSITRIIPQRFKNP